MDLGAGSHITRNPFGQLEAKFDVDHLSWWNLDWFYGSRCTWREPVTLQVQSNYESYGAPYAIARLVDATTGARFGYPRYMSLRNGSTIRLYNIPTGRNLRVQFLSSPSYYCQDVIFESATFTTSCQSVNMIDATRYQPRSRLQVQAAVAGICEREEADIQIRPSAWIYYRKLVAGTGTGCRMRIAVAFIAIASKWVTPMISASTTVGSDTISMIFQCNHNHYGWKLHVEYQPRR